MNSAWSWLIRHIFDAHLASHMVQVVIIIGFHPIDPGSSPGMGIPFVEPQNQQLLLFSPIYHFYATRTHKQSRERRTKANKKEHKHKIRIRIKIKIKAFISFLKCIYIYIKIFYYFISGGLVSFFVLLLLFCCGCFSESSKKVKKEEKFFSFASFEMLFCCCFRAPS